MLNTDHFQNYFSGIFLGKFATKLPSHIQNYMTFILIWPMTTKQFTTSIWTVWH